MFSFQVDIVIVTWFEEFPALVVPVPLLSPSLEAHPARREAVIRGITAKAITGLLSLLMCILFLHFIDVD
jgi:hypothetical protein